MVLPWSTTIDTKLHYELTGEGATSLVLIHELGGCLESWDPLVEQLGGEFRILRYDLRGAGRSETSARPFSMDDHAVDLKGLLDETRLPLPVLIAGAAAGAAVAVTFAARHPSDVVGLVLCAPALSVTADRRRYLVERSELAAREGMGAVIDQTLDRSFPPIVIRDPGRYRAYRERFMRNDPVSYGLANLALAESRADELRPSVRCPCLLLAGRHDTLRPLAHVRDVAAGFADANVEELDSAHIMSLQAPGDLATRIQRFRDEIRDRMRAK